MPIRLGSLLRKFSLVFSRCFGDLAPNDLLRENLRVTGNGPELPGSEEPPLVKRPERYSECNPRPIPRHEKYDVLQKPSRATSDRYIARIPIGSTVLLVHLPSRQETDNPTPSLLFKPLWKPGHLLDNNLKSCGNCLRPTAQIFLRAKNESIHEQSRARPKPNAG